jgi:integrase/recombinase XerD
VREYVDHPGAVAVLALDENDRVFLIASTGIRCARASGRSPPALLDVTGEDPLAAARRELAEEGDLAATEWAVLADFFTSPGGSDEAIRIYLARGLSAMPEAFAREDEEAHMETRWTPLGECVARRARPPRAEPVAPPSACSPPTRRGPGAGARSPRPMPMAGPVDAAQRADAARGADAAMTDAAWTTAYLRHLTVERGLSRNTITSYRRDLGIYADWLAARGIDGPASVREQDLADFVRHLGAERQPPLATSSIARVLSAVRGLHRFLAEEGVIVEDVSRELRPPKLPMRLPKAIPVEDVEALIAAVGGEDLHELRDTALLELLYATGARVSEAVSLNVDDLVDDEVVRLFGKGGKQRIVPLGSYARRAIDAYLVRARPALSTRGTATPALFVGLRGRRMSRQAAWDVIHRAAERAGLGASVSPHSPAPLVRDPSARGRGRRARRSGAARALVGRDHPDLHTRHSRYTPGDVHGCPPPCSLESTKPSHGRTARRMQERDQT